MILNKGYVMKNKSILEPYTMRFIMPEEIDQVITLQDHIYNLLPNKEIFYRDPKETLLFEIERGGRIIGVFNQVNQMIAYRYISFPGESEINLGLDIGLHESQFKDVVHLETTLVHPDYRGNGLQGLTLEKALKWVVPFGYKHMLCTVSPYNYFSLHNIMKAGLNIKALKKKYGTSGKDDGLWRFILHRDITSLCINNPSQYEALEMEKIKEQKQLIESGYVGYKLHKGSHIIHYTQDFCQN